MYARPEYDGGRLDFGVSGKLIMNALVMYDRQTETLWSQILGRAVEGPLAGAALEQAPYALMTWGEWRRLHPDSTALQTTGWDGRDPYAGYYDRSDAGVIGRSNPDHRLPAKAMVTGAVVAGVPVAYPWSALAGVSNHVVGGVPLLVVYAADASSSLIFDRRAGGRTLTFEPDPSAPPGAVGRSRSVVDTETGSRWSAWTGVAFDGPLTGTALELLPSLPAFWFAWSDFYPKTLVFEGPSG